MRLTIDYSLVGRKLRGYLIQAFQWVKVISKVSLDELLNLKTYIRTRNNGGNS